MSLFLFRGGGRVGGGNGNEELVTSCLSIVSYIYILRALGLGRWLNLVGDVMSFCSNTSIYAIYIYTNLEINK